MNPNSELPSFPKSVLTPVGRPTLLTLAESIGRSRTLRAWSPQQQRAVENILETLCKNWLRDWGVKGTDTSTVSVQTSLFRANDAQSADSLDWVVMPSKDSALGNRAVCWAFVSSTPSGSYGPVSAIQSALFGESQTRFETLKTDMDSLAVRVATQAWRNWWLQLEALTPTDDITELRSDSEAPSGALWSGDLQIMVPWPFGVLALRMDGAQVAKLLHHQCPEFATKRADSAANANSQVDGIAVMAPIKHTILQALTLNVLRVRAEFQELELSLGQIQTLQVGDVVQIEHGLSEPVSMVMWDDQVLCSAWLGQQDGHVAVELTAGNLHE